MFALIFSDIDIGFGATCPGAREWLYGRLSAFHGDQKYLQSTDLFLFIFMD